MNQQILALLVIPLSICFAVENVPRNCNIKLEQHASITSRHQVPSFDPNRFYWEFPSDHLPAIGIATLNESKESFPVMTWNIWNRNWVQHIKDNSQGLKHSGLTRTENRDEIVVQIIDETSDTVSPAIIGLQEVNDRFLPKLQSWAQKKGFSILIAENPLKNAANLAFDHGVILFDRNKFSALRAEVEFFEFNGKKKHYIQSVDFVSQQGVHFRFVNVHREYFDNRVFPEYLRRKISVPTILVGDLNLNENRVDLLLNETQSYKRMPKEPGAFTHINTSRKLEDFDHILFAGDVHLREDPELVRSARKRFSIRLD